MPRRPRCDRSRAVRALGAGRVLMGAAFLATPESGARLVGVDTATAKRMDFLARMLAGRDGAIGAGTMATASRGWLLAGAAADAVDAVAIGAALRGGRLRGWRPAAVAAGAAALAIAQVVLAVSASTRRAPV